MRIRESRFIISRRKLTYNSRLLSSLLYRVSSILSSVYHHRFGITLSAVIAFIFVFPQIAAPILVPSFQGISPMEADSETHYFSRIMSARYHGAIGNPFLADENEDFLPSLLSIESVFGRVAAILPFSVHFWNVMFRLCGSFLLAFFLYLLLFSMFQQEHFASSAMVVVLIGTTLILNNRELVPLFADQQHSLGFLHFSRFINPAASGVPFFAFCYLVYRAIIQTDVSKVQMLILGAVLGLLLYAYFFFWVFAFTLIAIICIYLYLTRAHTTRRWLLSISVALLIDLPYLVSIGYRYGSRPSTGAAQHLGLAATHEPLIDTLLVIYTILLVVLTFMDRRNASMRSVWLFNMFFCISGWIVVNQQVITQYSLQPGHFQWYMLAPGLLLAFVSLLYGMWSRMNTFARSSAVFVALLFFLGSGLLVQYRASAATNAVLGERQLAADALHWLLRNGISGSVVFANRENANLVPVYTDDKVFYANSVIVYPVERERIYLGHFMWWRSENLSLDQLADRIRQNPESIKSIYESDTFHRIRTREPERFVAVIADLLGKYESFLRDDPGSIFDRYEVRYLLEQKSADDFRALLVGNERTVYDDGFFRILERTLNDQP